MKPGDTIKLDNNIVANVIEITSHEGDSFSGVASVNDMGSIFWGCFKFSKQLQMWIRK